MKVKRAGVPTKLLVLILLAAVAAALLSMQAQLAAAQAERAELNRQVQVQQEANASLADDIAHSGDPEHRADIARDKLGLLEPDEIVFEDSSQ